MYDYVNVKLCISCCRFGHNKNAKNCRNDLACLKCSGPHHISDCNSDVKKCANCTYSNIKFSTNYNLNHMASDATSCEILKSKIKKYIDSTDYSLKPVLPSVVHTWNKQMENILEQQQQPTDLPTEAITERSS